MKKKKKQNRTKKILQLIILQTLLQTLIIKILRKLTESVQKNLLIFLTIDTTLHASDPLRLRKSLFDAYKNDNN